MMYWNRKKISLLIKGRISEFLSIRRVSVIARPAKQERKKSALFITKTIC